MIKFIIPIILSAFSCSAQVYKFDLLSVYSITGENQARERVIYANSTDSGYFLVLSGNKKKQAKLYDLTNRKYYTYKCKNKNKGNRPEEFILTKQDTILITDRYDDYKFTFQIVSKDSTSTNVILKSIPSNETYPIKFTYDINSVQHKNNLFHLFRFSCIHPFEFYESITMGYFGLIQSATADLNGHKRNYILKSLDDVNLELKIN